MASTSGISFSGLSSGLDTDSIVTALTGAETTRKNALQTKQNSLKLKQTAYATVKSQMSGVARAAGTLNTASTYSTFAGTTGDSNVATIATTSSAAVGSYNLNVTVLAKANKVATSPQADTTTALGRVGVASINGKALKIESSDSLANVAQKINGLAAGLTASVVDGGSGRAYLTLSSGTTGVANAVSAADLSGTVLKDLGLVGTAATVRQASGETASGFSFTAKNVAIGGMMGATGLAASTITVGGADVSIDPATDTLDDVATKINAAGIAGVTATVEAGTKDGATVYSLKISGSGTPPAMSDSGGLLKGLGILRSTPANELVAAQDAAFTLDGVSLTSSTNAVTGVIAGATLTLKKAGDTSVSLARDTAAITNGVQGLVTAANTLFSTIKAYSSFDKSTYATGVLFGDSLANQAKDSVRSLLFSDTPGVTGSLRNLASVGMGLDTDGNVTLDGNKFQAALDKDLAGIQALLQSLGTGSNSSIKYVSATSAAQASPSASPYAVNIAQVATRASLVAGTAQTGPRSTAETLTFRGSAFGASGIGVDFEVGTDLATTVSKINADSRLKDLVTASVENGRLRIDAKKYGTAGDFTLASNFASSDSNSGVGVGGEGTYVTALNVAGTINNEPATGNGQFLSGNVGNAHTQGLQIQYSGTTLGNVGTIAYSRGAASRMSDLASSFTDSLKGFFTTADSSLQTQIDSLNKDMATIDDRIASKTNELKLRFASMEDAIAKLKTTSSTVSSMLLSNNSSQ